ncbi:MAG TPA: hypothetical protein VMT38_03665, partial [Terracidiphilus sp.]|nr:hypothetical protein [Terracidiphilus sp.]
MNTRVSSGTNARRFASDCLALAVSALAVAAVTGPLALSLNAQDFGRGHDFDRGFGEHEFHGFVPGSIVLSGTVYVGRADTVVPGEVLPPGCLNT